MDIYPQDLGRRDYVGLLCHRRRLEKNFGVPVKKEATARQMKSPPPLTRLRRFWTFGNGIDEETVRHGQRIFDCDGGPIKFLLWTWGLACAGVLLFNYLAWSNDGAALNLMLLPLDGCMLLTLSFSVFVTPRLVFRRHHKKLSDNEVGRLRAEAQDPLKQDYWEIVRVALRPEMAADRAGAEMLRAALHSLGLALEGLPQHVAEVSGDAGQLQTEAETLAADARQEPDSVIAGSLLRRAEALSVRADTTARASLLLRRNVALRREIGEQMNALRTSLAVLNLGGHAPDELATLASGIQRIAAETASLAAAHLELEAAAPSASLEQVPLVRLFSK